MATASSEMVATLVRDLGPVQKKMAKLQAHVKEYDGSELAALVKKEGDLLEKMGALIGIYDAASNENPPRFPEEKDYKALRAGLTKSISTVESLEKKALAEKKVFDAAVTIKVVGAARAEILGKDKALAQALAAVARGDKGRTSPKTDDLPALNHIHIGGQAKDNLIFDPSKKLILGRIPFHMDSSMSKSQKDKVKKVSERSGSVFTAQILNKEDISAV